MWFLTGMFFRTAYQNVHFILGTLSTCLLMKFINSWKEMRKHTGVCTCVYIYVHIRFYCVGLSHDKKCFPIWLCWIIWYFMEEKRLAWEKWGTLFSVRVLTERDVFCSSVTGCALMKAILGRLQCVAPLGFMRLP